MNKLYKPTLFLLQGIFSCRWIKKNQDECRGILAAICSGHVLLCKRFVHCWFCVSESYLTVISLASFWITIWFTLSARHSSSSVTGVLTDQTGKIMKKNISITKEIKNTENNTKRDRKTRVESAISVKPNWSLKYRPRYEFSRRRIQQCFWRTAWKSSYCGGTKALSSRLGFA